MSECQTSSADHHQPGLYEIRVKGHLDDKWAVWFSGMTLTPQANGDTLLTGPVIDQAALHGLLKKARDLGLPLVSFHQIQPDQAGRSDSAQEKEKK